MGGRVAKGDLTFDYWHGKTHRYSICDLRTGDETGWYGVDLEGECTPEQCEQLREAGKAVLR